MQVAASCQIVSTSSYVLTVTISQPTNEEQLNNAMKSMTEICVLQWLIVAVMWTIAALQVLSASTSKRTGNARQQIDTGSQQFWL